MKKNILLLCAALLSATPLLSRAQTNIAAWTFENDAVLAPTLNPAPSTFNGLGIEFAASIGMTNWAATALGTNDPDVLAGKGSDTGANGITNTSHEWRIRAQNTGGTANGWSTNAPIGTQGAEFAVDTTGYNDITVHFDWYATTQGEGNLELLYTDDGSNWINVPINVPAAESELASNYNNGLDTNTVTGYYVSNNSLSNSLDGQDWFTNLTAIITNDPGAGNNPNFAIEIVNASTLGDCISAAGTLLNNSSGNWRFDNVAISGVAVPRPFVKWNFEGVPQVVTPDPAPSLNDSIGAVSAACMGMDLFGGGTTNSPDVTLGASGDTGTDGITNYTQIWRVRGASGNGWTSAAGIGTQGAQFTADTTGYTNIAVGFDWYLTTQGEGHLQLEYTIDGINWINLPITIPAAQAGTSLNFVDNTADSDAYSVQGYYVNTSAGQNWFTNLTAVITNPAAANNPKFGVRMVNASTGSSCVNSGGTGLNNSSGNWRFDNVYVSGLPSAVLLSPPPITPSPVATVDGPFTNTFTDSVSWRTNISGITINGTKLASAAYVISSGLIVFTPSASTLLQAAGSITIAISATNYNTATVIQNVSPGAAKKLVITAQPVAPTGNGGTLVAQPALAIYDQYSNVATNGTATYTAAPSAGWTFGPGSSPTQTLANGVLFFTNLSAISPAAISGATITFTASSVTNLGALPYTTTNSVSFNIPAPATTGFMTGNLAVEQEDVASKNSTFSILELSPTISNQSTPVNTYPVPATGTNALRQSSSGSTGRVADSQDGTLLCFSAALCGDSTVSDSTTVDPRGAGTFNAAGDYALPATYVGLGDATANQARSAVTVDDITYFMGDKGGVYTNGNTASNPYIPYSVNNPANVRGLKSFGGVVYALQQEGGTDPDSTVMAVVPAPSTGSQALFPLEGFPTDGSVLDFYLLRSGNNGTNYDVCYYIDGTNTTTGAIFKFYYTGQIDQNSGQQIWANAGSAWPGSGNGSWPTPNGGDGLCAVTNINGGVDLYYTTGSGGSSGNSVIHVFDSSAWNQPINITGTNLLYTVSAQATLKGIAFAPLALPGSPSVETLPASPVTLSSATMNGSINPNGGATAYWFQYGQVGNLNGFTATNTLAAGSSPIGVSVTLTGLPSGTFYQYKLVASNAVATISGPVVTFSTLSVTAPKINAAVTYSSGSFALSFTNSAGASFTVWGATNLLSPWQNLGHPVESPAGTYSFTNTSATNPAEFYRVTSP